MLRYHQQILPSFEVYPLSGAKNKHYIASNHGVSVPFFESHTAWQRALRTQNIHRVYTECTLFFLLAGGEGLMMC